jgi:NADH-quinone oxidoreductase subunit H
MLSASLSNFYFLTYTISFSLLIIVCILIAVAYYTLLDRKILAAMQRRQGPNVVGFAGLLQPLADGLKLFVKETIIPVQANSFLFLLAPVLTFVTSMVG